MAKLRVGIVDSGIDLQKLYRGERHGYEAVWVPVEGLSFEVLSACDLVIVPAGTDNTFLSAKRDCLRHFLNRGGWVYSFDGMTDRVFEGCGWTHSPTSYRTQSLRVVRNEFSFLLDGVLMEGLACKEGVRGWWCEGELVGNEHVPLIMDDKDRVVASIVPPRHGSGALVATAAGRLPVFSADPLLPPNVFFANLLRFCQEAKRGEKRGRGGDHLYVHSGNWAQRSFLRSDRFGAAFSGIHWSCLDELALENACSVWIPWESNTRALRGRWPLLENAVSQGASLVIEDMRDDWLPGFRWQSRPVDSSWWREGRELDLKVLPQTTRLFPDLPVRAYQWHYHGVLDCPADAVPLVTTTDAKIVLAVCAAVDSRAGVKLVGTLDATFEYGAGKIKETAAYITGVLDFLLNRRGVQAQSESAARSRTD
jgi:hypothetical protein